MELNGNQRATFMSSIRFSNKRIPINRAIRLSEDTPTAFNPYTAQWGEARQGKKIYYCVTFNFGGLGESGSFQNIRGVYLIAVKNLRPELFYFAGDLRQTGSASSK
jgi:hypothetical protein